MSLVKSAIDFFSCRLAHLLSGDVCQVVVLVIRAMVSPHHKDNLQPLGSQCPKRLGMAMPLGPLVPIVGVGPFASIERGKRQPVRGVAHLLVTGKTTLHETALATRFGHRHRSRLGLKMPKGFPVTLGIPQLSPKHGHDRPVLSSRQRLHQLSYRHGGEKTFNPLAVALHRFNQALKLNEQHTQQLRLGSDHMVRDRQLKLMELVPQLVTARLTQMMLALGKTLPVPAAKLRERLWGWIPFEKIPRDLRFQIAKDLQGPRVVLFERDLELIEQPSFLAHQAVVIPSEQLKLLGLMGVGLQRSQVSMIGPNKLRQNVSVKRITLGLAHAKPIPDPIQRLGIDRINRHPVIQKKLHNPPVRLLDGRPKFYLFRLTLVEPAAKLAHPFWTLDHLHLDYLLALWITDPHLMKLIRPIHSQIVSRHFLFLLPCVFPIPRAVNGMFALYRSSKGQLSIEPLSPFFCWSGQSRSDPPRDEG